MSNLIQPLGLMPRDLYNEKRFYDVCCAIKRYYNAGLKIPIEWIEEYNDWVDIGVSNNKPIDG